MLRCDNTGSAAVYLRPAFVQADKAAIIGLIRDNPFAQIVTHGGRGMEGSHLPFHLLEEADGFTIAGHFAAGNPQCDAIGAETDALIIFSGPHAYISPSWYETQPSVPTWDFAAVHLYGRLEPVADPALIASDIHAMATYDPGQFDVMALTQTYRDRMFAGIRAFRMRPSRVEGQWKMSQNRSITDRRRVVAALRAEGNAAVAEMVAATLPEAAE